MARSLGFGPSASFTSRDAHVFGMATFNADRTYSLDFTVSHAVDTYVPKACFPGATCADIIDPANPQLVMDIGDACTSTQMLTTPAPETGTYQLNGGRMSMIPDGSGGLAADPFDFCVLGGDILTGRQDSADGTSVTYVAKQQ